MERIEIVINKIKGNKFVVVMGTENNSGVKEVCNNTKEIADTIQNYVESRIMEKRTIEDKMQDFQLGEVDIRREIFEAIDGAKDLNLGLENGDYVDIKEVKYRDVYLTDGSILNITTKELIDLYYIVKAKKEA